MWRSRRFSPAAISRACRIRALAARRPVHGESAHVELDLGYERYEIADPTGEAPGTIVVDTKMNYLYFVLPNKRAIRYGVATGSEAFGWTGTPP